LEIRTVLEFVVHQSEQLGEGEDCFDFIEDWSETSLLIGVGSGDGVFDEIVDPGEYVVNRETSVVQILDELLDFGFGTDGVDEFCPFRSLEIENNSSESAVSLEMFVGDSFDVVKRKEVDKVLQIVSQSSTRFAQFGCTPAQEIVNDSQSLDKILMAPSVISVREGSSCWSRSRLNGQWSLSNRPKT
jgi:hypothetical protein